MDNKIQFRRYTSLSSALQLMLKQYGLAPEFRRRRIYAAWDEASGASAYTVRRYFSEGRLYVTVSSSVLRSQLYFQKNALLEQINRLLGEDELFGGKAGKKYVKELIIK